MTHIIRQQYLHVEVNGTESEGLTVQRRLPGLCQHWLIPAIEGVLERCAPPAGHWYIERLEIDAGALSLERLEQDLAENVALALEKSLREHLPWGESALPLTTGVIQPKTPPQALQEALIYFLQTGSLPWSFRLPPDRTLEQVVLEAWQEAAQSGLSPLADREAMLRVVSDAVVRQRLVRQFSWEFLETLLARLAPPASAVVTEVFQTLSRADLPPIAAKQFALRLWETAFAGIAAARVLTSASLVSAAWELTATAQPALAHVLERHWPQITHHILVPSVIIPGSERVPAEAEVLDSLPPEATTIPDRQPPEAQEIIIPKPVRPSPGKTEHPEAREGIFINNAGLVLLHPFLPQFFAALDITADDTLRQPERALCLLHFLTTGQTSAPEYELVLPKILCNIPLAYPVATNLDLTGPEIEEALSLLEAVIHHWEALRHTSLNGLRGTFLLRPGKVTQRDDGDWLLQVETKAFDILLEQLPWGISPVRLPWMPYLVRVEWR